MEMLGLLQEYCGENGYDWMESKNPEEIETTILYWVKIEAVRDEVKDWAEEISKYYYRDYQKVIKKLWDSYKLRKRIDMAVTLKKSLVHTQTKNILSYLYK
jgi:DNA-binding SARP family transcriptional activator